MLKSNTLFGTLCPSEEKFAGLAQISNVVLDKHAKKINIRNKLPKSIMDEHLQIPTTALMQKKNVEEENTHTKTSKKQKKGTFVNLGWSSATLEVRDSALKKTNANEPKKKQRKWIM
jgi:hypothetical protein